MDCHYTTLGHEALLHVVGPDTLKFLQGQTSCDTRRIDANHAIPGVFCTPKGRVVCDFLLCELGPDHFALRLRRDIRAASSAAFGKYIIFSKAELDYVLVQTDKRGQQFECFLHETSAQQHLDAMQAEMTPSTESEWQALQIANGSARIEAATVEEFVPQILNYDRTGHISFKKGCYTGQEVVARLHYLGKPKRRTYVAELPSGTDCAAGSAVYDAKSGSEAGNIVNCCTVGEKIHVLVAAATSSLPHGLLLGAANGPALTLGKMPYTLEDD